MHFVVPKKKLLGNEVGKQLRMALTLQNLNEELDFQNFDVMTKFSS